MNVREGARWARALLHDVISFFATTVAKAVGDASFWCCASVVGCVVLNFLSHLALPCLKVCVSVGSMRIARSAIIGSVALDDVSIRDTGWVARSDVALCSLRTCFVNRPASAAA